MSRSGSLGSSDFKIILIAKLDWKKSLDFILALLASFLQLLNETTDLQSRNIQEKDSFLVYKFLDGANQGVGDSRLFRVQRLK